MSQSQFELLRLLGLQCEWLTRIIGKMRIGLALLVSLCIIDLRVLVVALSCMSVALA